jgi:CheY-like chemotaxis protein
METRSILVVDDDAQLLEMTLRLLQAEGYLVFGAADGRKASQMLARQPFDVVLTDLLMPDRDGLELIGELRRRYPETRIVAMTGGGRIARDRYIDMAKGIGAHELLRKPFDRAQLLAAVGKALEGPAERP